MAAIDYSTRPTTVLRQERATLLRGAQSVSASGEVLNSWTGTPIAVSIPADIQPQSGSYRQREYGRAADTTHIMHVDADIATATVVAAGDRVVSSGVTYVVTFVAPRRRHVEIDLAKVIVP